MRLAPSSKPLPLLSGRRRATTADISSHKLPKGDACQAIVEVRDEDHQWVITMTVSMRIDRPTPVPQALSPWAA